MTQNDSTTQPAGTTQHESAQASLLAGVSKPAGTTRKPARRSASTRKPAGNSKPAQRTSARKPAGKPAQSDAGARTESQRKNSVMSAMILICADAVRSDASYVRFVRAAKSAGIDLSDVKRSDARDMLAKRLSYAPGDYWDAALSAPTVLQAGKRSKIARTAAQQRVTRSAARKSATRKSTPATRKPAQRKSA